VIQVGDSVFAVALFGFPLSFVEFFEEVRIKDWRTNSVVAGSPGAEVKDAAAIGAEGNVWGVERDGLFADGAAEFFGHDCSSLTLM